MTHKYIILSDDNDPNALQVVESKTRESVVAGILEATARQTLTEARRIRDGLELNTNTDGHDI